MLIFFAINAVLSTGACFVHPVTPRLLMELEMPDYMFGVLNACTNLMVFLLSPMVGKLNSVFSSKNVLAVGCFGYSLSQLWFCNATTELTLILARLCAGCMYVTVQVCALTYVVNTSAAGERSGNLSVRAAIQSASTAFGYFIGGLLGELALRYAFYAQIAVMSIGGLLAFLLLKRDAAPGGGSMPLGTLLRQANPFAVFRQCGSFLNRRMVILFLALTFSNLAASIFDQSFNYYIANVFRLGSSWNGTLRAITGVTGLVMNSTLCLWIVKKTDVKRSLTIVMGVGCGVMLAMILIGAQIPLMALDVMLKTIVAIKLPLVQGIVADSADSSNSNLVMGFYNSVNAFGLALGSLIAGFAYNIFPKLAFIVGLCIYLPAVAGIVLYRRELARPQADK